MTCLPDCGRLLRNCAAFAVFAPALPTYSQRHCCSRAKGQPGRIRTPRQAELAAGQHHRQRSTGSGHCLQASSSGWEGVFSLHARLNLCISVCSICSDHLSCARAFCLLFAYLACLTYYLRCCIVATEVHLQMHVEEAWQHIVVASNDQALLLLLQRLSTLA